MYRRAAAPKISVVAPVRNEERHIRWMLEGLLEQDFNLSTVELIIADGISDDGTRLEVQRFKKEHGDHFHRVVMIDNPGRTAPCGLNLALNEVQSEYWLRIDGHSRLARNYLRTCLDFIGSHPNAVSVSGPLTTEGEGWLGEAIAVAQSSPWGVGAGNFRTVSGRPEQVDTHAFALVSTAVSHEAGCFDESLRRNQDDEFCSRLARLGELWIEPATEVAYRCRGDLVGLGKQYFGYGLYKPSVLVRPDYQVAARHLTPALAVLAHVGWMTGTVTKFRRKTLIRVAMVSLSAHLLALIGLAAREEQVEHNVAKAVAAGAAGLTMHLAYGAGFLAGLRSGFAVWAGRHAGQEVAPVARHEPFADSVEAG